MGTRQRERHKDRQTQRQFVVKQKERQKEGYQDIIANRQKDRLAEMCCGTSINLGKLLELFVNFRRIL